MPQCLHLGITITTILLALIACHVSASGSPAADSTIRLHEPLESIAFGSCNRHELPQEPLWPLIHQRRPNVFAWRTNIPELHQCASLIDS